MKCISLSDLLAQTAHEKEYTIRRLQILLYNHAPTLEAGATIGNRVRQLTRLDYRLGLSCIGQVLTTKPSICWEYYEGT